MKKLLACFMVQPRILKEVPRQFMEKAVHELPHQRLKKMIPPGSLTRKRTKKKKT
jgi:hypothetical protein